MNVIVWCFWTVSVLLSSCTHALENCEIIVDITNGTTNGTNIVSNNATYTTNDYFTNSSGVFGCLCNVLNCVQDCCDSGQVLDFSGSVLKCTSATSQRYTNLKGAIVHNIIHVPDKFVCSEQEQTVSLEASEYPLELLEHGYLQWDINTYHYRKYCLSAQESELVVLVCVVADATVSAIIFCIGMIISMPFLLITFLVYALLPDRNLHQRALMFYVLSLLIAYILLVTINLAPNIPTWFWCKFLGYSTLFFFMVSFFWMNVICFDIWYTFSGGRGFMGSKRTSERRRLIFYSLYANGVPLLIVAWTYGMQISLPNECEHNPGIGVAKCFLATGWASLWYFYLEAGIVVIANITFFILTALRIRKVKQETSMLKHNDSKRHTYEKDKQKFNLYVKLLFAMGVNWSMEVISWLVNWNTKSEYQYIWYATDFFNAVYGVFIFFIFVFKKKIWTLLQRRYYNFIGRPHLAHTVTSSNTRSSHYSSTNYSTADTGLSERATAVNGRQPAEEMALRRVT
ncbi:hypothetical protein HUJ04_004101 [Dendroctonus ponderosae]|uniref:G-protein coupled receptors family 2 profile 2 domain-containing protein n=1 Tax=Dendroctonus ponderosae TaxID=77166 RepID=A0AAR5PPC7_DENPD|nr:hypothetical protein HUJ04_004101 [Dendroctonus ponderosae]KAH1004329.1 hypothetical protein HUJ04_004101 [Dendroctonus ponderosae]